MTDDEVRRGVSDTLLDYCQFLDEKRLDEWTAIFTDDIQFEEAGLATGKAHIRAKVRKLLLMFDRLSHHLSNIRVKRTGAETAESMSYIYAYHKMARGGDLELWGRYVDQLRFEDGRWKIAKHTVMIQGGRGLDDIRILKVPQHELPAA